MDLPRDIPIVRLEVLSHHGPSDAMHNPPQLLKVSQKTLVSFLMKTNTLSIDFLTPNYALWEVIVNGDSPPPKRTVDGVEQTYPPTTTEEKLARKNELKARGTDNAKIIRKRSKPDKHEHGNGKSAKEPEDCYQWST
ncbi:hypothetical protein Tco_1577020 [Tanacetum coccineum]